jgi:hypothetical protein
MRKLKQQLNGFICGILIFAGAILPVTVFAQDPLSFWTIHCEYPGGTPEHPSIEDNDHWIGIVDKIKWADNYGVKLSLSMTGRWADAVMNGGHQDTILMWIENGHIVGTHTDPEIKEEGKWIVYKWDNIPKDKMQQAIDDAIAAVNRVVGESNNKYTDNPAVFSSAFGGKGYFHKQMTHLLVGNFGHNYPCRIFLSDGREITFVAYRGVIQKNTRDWGSHISLEDAISEYNEGGEAYGPVHFPGCFPTSGPLIGWMKWLYDNNKPRVGATAISAPDSSGRSLDRFVRMWTEWDETPDVSLTTMIKIQNSSNTDLTNIKITHYMPLTYCDFESGSASPPATSSATELRRHLIWDNQTIPANSTVTYVYTGNRTYIDGNHRVENRMDTYLDDLSTTPSISRRYAMVDIGAWSFLPFESVAFTPPNPPTYPLCESEINPTDVVDPAPEFSWRYDDPDVMDHQQSYRILVASSLSNLNNNNGDMWDSGEVESADSSITYAGTPLANYSTYYWKIMTRDPIGFWGSYCPAQSFTTGAIAFTQNYDDSPFGFIQGEVVRGYRPSAEYLNDLGVFWNKIALRKNAGIVIKTNDTNNINFQTDVNFSGMDAYLQTLIVDNGINITMPLMVFVKVNGEETKLDFDDYEELATVMIEHERRSCSRSAGRR